MRSLAIGVVLAAAVAGCGPPPGALFAATISNPNGELPLPVELRDQTGLVVRIGAARFDPIDFRDAGVLADPTQPTAFILTWLGGMCDDGAALVFRSVGAGFDVHVTIHVRFGSCPAAGVFRGVRIETSEPIPPGSITISGSKTIQLILDEDCGPLRAAATSDAKVACYALIGATIGDRTAEFARVTVSPDDGACPGTECTTAEGIAAQPWRVDATDRTGQSHHWRCAYREERASCTVITLPPAS